MGQVGARREPVGRPERPHLPVVGGRAVGRPPGQYPWSRVQHHVTQILVDRSPRSANPIHHRLERLNSFNPNEIFVGQGGFRSYIAYVFVKKNLAVLESVMLDNATYVFGQNWQQVSRLTKAQVIQGDLHLVS